MLERGQDEISEKDLYAGIDLDLSCRYEDTRVDGRCVLLENFGEARTLYAIDRFVKECAKLKEKAIEVTQDRHGGKRIKQKKIGSYLNRIAEFLSVENPKLYYSEYVECFFQAARELSVDPVEFTVGCAVLDSSIDRFNEIVYLTGERARRPETKKKLDARAVNANRQRGSLVGYLDRLFEWHAKLLIIRIDLSYQPLVAIGLRMGDIDRDIGKLLNNYRNKPIFRHIEGYSIKLEYGLKKGPHAHALFAFNGAKVKRDAYIAANIGEYWQNVITEGKGMHYNCNRSKNEYMRCGIGMVSHDDVEKRGNLVLAASYLAKKEQHFMAKEARNMRTFRRGVIRKPREGSIGRPRKATSSGPVGARHTGNLGSQLL